jgi:hypothetical protein
VARLAQLLGLVTALALSGATLASCGTGAAVADARHSCVDVTGALALQSRSEGPGLSAGRRHRLQNDALAELLRGTPAAAAATSIDGSWNPLMTTINEAERVPLADLTDTLRRMCRIANSSTPYL